MGEDRAVEGFPGVGHGQFKFRAFGHVDLAKAHRLPKLRAIARRHFPVIGTHLEIEITELPKCKNRNGGRQAIGQHHRARPAASCVSCNQNHCPDTPDQCRGKKEGKQKQRFDGG
ncbi:hypothetical protein D3C72_1946730 [compost metagenome]